MDPFEIPARTFTSFRLAYLRSPEVAESSKCLFLGSFPHIWIHDEGSALASGQVKHAKRNVRNTLDESVNRITNNYRYLSRRLNPNSQSRLETVISDIKQQYLQQENSSEEDVSDSDSENYDDFGVHDFAGDQGDGQRTDEISRASESFQISDTTIDHLNLNDIAVSELQPKHSVSSAATSAVTTNTASRTSGLKVDFNQPITPKKSRISLAHPEPCTEISEDFIAAEKERHRLRRKLKTLAHNSKGKAKKTTNDIRYRIHRTVLKTFKAGEIILRERGLVLTKETLNVKSFNKFEENEPCDTRVYERWREYSIVLRKTEDESITLQFYRLENQEKKHGKQRKSAIYKDKNSVCEENEDRQVKPEYEYELNSQLKADIYSSVDKSISISVPKNNWCMIHIIRFHFQARSFKWLYFIKQSIGDPLISSIDISIPDINMRVSLAVPEEVFLESFKEVDTIKIQPLEKDYRMHHTPLLEYIIDTVRDQLSKSRNQKIINFLNGLDKPWFCFKSYDRLEWVIDDSELFFIQNQILQGHFQLELRNLDQDKKHIDSKEFHLTEPVPIEGFLARLTNVRGYEQSIIRTFYKISYFNTSDHLMFFTKYYRGLPPRATNQLKDIYEHCSFPLDENDHIPWLNTDEFDKQDHLALEEFERKAHLILKADSVIDLTSVISINPVPLNKIKLAHKVLLSVLWYGSSAIIDDKHILDSCFEITTINNGKIRLQAPNKTIRDEWIQRLTEIKNYWVTKKQLEIETIDQIRTQNMKQLNINEYIDSNINQETSLIEIQYSKADPFVNSIDGTALTNNLLMSGYLYQKPKKHSNFSQYFAVLSSGSLILYSLYKRSKLTGEWKRASYFQHYITIPLIDCYLYSGLQTSFDLVDQNQGIDPANPGHKSLSRIYVDGWKSSDEESMRCFTIWFGAKRSISHNSKSLNEPKNPSLISMIRKLGITGQSIVFMTRSRQEREMWVTRIYTEIDRHRKIYNL